MKKQASASDPLWFKDAIIYELHVRAFADSNNDGIGDFQGLISKLDYLQELGVTCLWLLPFFPSPLRDDGYDIANYVDVNPSYGTLADFRQFLDAAHQRNMQVMIELVINHTSDQHPWFQAARHAAPGSPEREMYVWSTTDQLYRDARIIFTDTEKSNWTWDETAKAYYWHRFFSHQPDLNFDNPRVLDEVISAMRFWLDMGVDALRMDAIPYLIERDNTSCENLPDTHRIIKKIRAAIDAEYANRLVLAEANQWPSDVRPYFGDGDECHMAFHFPLMPRIYMALRQEDRLPITDIMAQTPAIPETCQWGLFLRNHDELTLEMVTDDERDYMYIAYSSDPRMRINVGIRRRLAPLLDNNRRRIELLNSLLLSFPGTPILYYGDEIGMGDNIYLGDRNGVRTPMQWNSDRNAGFSKCDPARLYFPVVMDPVYGYQSVNVEMQLTDQSSLLHWTRNMIALRKLFQVFGRGSLSFLEPSNRKVLAYIRKLTRDDGSMETVLCVANLSRFAQPVDLDLRDYAGMKPVEMLGYVAFPTITQGLYPLTLAPYSFFWFELQPAAASEHSEDKDQMEQSAHQEALIAQLAKLGMRGLLTGPARQLLETSLPAWLISQRWFGFKSKTIQGVQLSEFVSLSEGLGSQAAAAQSGAHHGVAASYVAAALLVVRVTFSDGDHASYQLPVALRWEEIPAAHATTSANVITQITGMEDAAVLYDATSEPAFQQSLWQLMSEQLTVHAEQLTVEGDSVDAKDAGVERNGSILVGAHSDSAVELSSKSGLIGRVGVAEQSNTNIFFAEEYVLKLFRQLRDGENPEIEVTRFLTDVARYRHAPEFVGSLTLSVAHIQKTSVGVLQRFVKGEDGWRWTLNGLSQFLTAVSNDGPPAQETIPASFLQSGLIAPRTLEWRMPQLEAAALLGTRTAELHLALATPCDDPAFAVERTTTADQAYDAERLRRQAATTLTALKSSLPKIPDDTLELAVRLLNNQSSLHEAASLIGTLAPVGKRIRIHGDYHLGQVLKTEDDFILLDFEGEPAKSLDERRKKQSPLRDVAGMLRSFSYVAWAAVIEITGSNTLDAQTLIRWSREWERAISSSFLNSYKTAIAVQSDLLPSPMQCDQILRAYLLEKAMYELLYELDNRPSWASIPLTGILALLDQ